MSNIEILLDQLYISAEKIKEVSKNFNHEITAGLNGEASSLMMIPSFIGKPSGKENGTYLAVDMGGTNVRAARFTLSKSGITKEAEIKSSLKSDIITITQLAKRELKSFMITLLEWWSQL